MIGGPADECLLVMLVKTCCMSESKFSSEVSAAVPTIVIGADLI